MNKIGISEDNKLVLSDVFWLSGTHGLPLEIILEYFIKNNFVIAWDEYVSDAIKDGHKLATTKARIFAAIGDVYGAEYLRQFICKFTILIST